MVDKEKILSCIYRAVDEVNEQLPEDKRLEKSPDMPCVRFACTVGLSVEIF